jgi:hypothetical protein
MLIKVGVWRSLSKQQRLALLVGMMRMKQQKRGGANV